MGVTGRSEREYERRREEFHNGTWIYLMEESEIVDGMIFKGNQNLFECKYEYKVNERYI